MANPEHLEILKQGVNSWNEWRRKCPYIQPHLNDADLSGIDLSHANLRYTLLGRVNLNHTNLSYADLIGAVLNGATLDRADLSYARLSGANLTSVYLGYANLNYADLSYANFRRTILSGADFTNSHWQGTNLVDVNLSEAIGLETVSHLAPSSIGIDTIYNSRGNIPEAFLRGCGVPDEFIAYMRSLVANPIQFYSCFISYSSRNRECAERLYSDLQNKGVRCWFAPEDLKIGDKIRDRIDESIRLRDKLLLILSEHSIASDWVEHEVESALEEEKQRGRAILFPIRLDDAAMESSKAWAALIRRTRHIGDFTRWKDHDSYQKAFDRLLRDLNTEESIKPTLNIAQDSLRDRAVLSPRKTFSEEWKSLESSIIQAAKRNGWVTEGDLVDCGQLINKLFEAGVISKAAREEYFSLNKWHDNVVLVDSSPVEPEMAITFANRARELQKAFE